MAYQHRVLTFNDVLLPFWAILWTVVAFLPVAYLANLGIELSGWSWLQDWYGNSIYTDHAKLAIFSAVVAIIYMIPIHIAFWRRAKDRKIVFFFTFFLGWTGIAWLLGLWLSFLDPWDY